MIRSLIVLRRVYIYIVPLVRTGEQGVAADAYQLPIVFTMEKLHRPETMM